MNAISVRRLKLEEMDQAAAIHRAAFDAQLPWLAGLHTPEEDRAYFRGHVFGTSDVWGAATNERLVGIMALRGEWIDQLYVLPDWHRRGIGSSLLRFAQAASPMLMLWTFQRNEEARGFYEAYGFVAIEETDGARNDEHEPDVLYRWQRPGTAPVSI